MRHTRLCFRGRTCTCADVLPKGVHRGYTGDTSEKKAGLWDVFRKSEAHENEELSRELLVFLRSSDVGFLSGAGRQAEAANRQAGTVGTCEMSPRFLMKRSWAAPMPLRHHRGLQQVMQGKSDLKSDLYLCCSFVYVCVCALPSQAPIRICCEDPPQRLRWPEALPTHCHPACLNQARECAPGTAGSRESPLLQQRLQQVV